MIKFDDYKIKAKNLPIKHQIGNYYQQQARTKLTKYSSKLKKTYSEQLSDYDSQAWSICKHKPKKLRPGQIYHNKKSESEIQEWKRLLEDDDTRNN